MSMSSLLSQLEAAKKQNALLKQQALDDREEERIKMELQKLEAENAKLRAERQERENRARMQYMQEDEVVDTGYGYEKVRHESNIFNNPNEFV